MNGITKVKRTIDAGMLLALLFLMAYQVTEEAAHEWIGMGEVALVVLHQVLNRHWYGVLRKGKYNSFRILTTAVTGLLLFSFALTAFSGMAMSGYAVPFLYGMGNLSDPQTLHLSFSHWTFVLMGVHLGLHVPAMLGTKFLQNSIKPGTAVILAMLPCYGLYRFVENDMLNYLFFQQHFAFLDFDKPAPLVLLENLLMLLPFVFAGMEGALLCRKKTAPKNQAGK